MKKDDLISRAALLKDLSYCAPELWQDEEYIKAKIIKQPAVDAAPVVHGRWKDNGNGTVSCNWCATWFPKIRQSQLLFCGYCGAKMED